MIGCYLSNCQAIKSRANVQTLQSLQCLHLQSTVKTCLKRPLKKMTKNWFLRPIIA